MHKLLLQISVTFEMAAATNLNDMTNEIANFRCKKNCSAKSKKFSAEVLQVSTWT
jgi:hypothetical protein